MKMRDDFNLATSNTAKKTIMKNISVRAAGAMYSAFFPINFIDQTSQRLLRALVVVIHI